MKSIYKYQFPIMDDISIDMPLGAKILTCQIQHKTPKIWAIVDTDPSWVETVRNFKLFGTGHKMPDNIDNLSYISTFLAADDNLVFHLFEVIE